MKRAFIFPYFLSRHIQLDHWLQSIEQDSGSPSQGIRGICTWQGVAVVVAGVVALDSGSWDELPRSTRPLLTVTGATLWEPGGSQGKNAGKHKCPQARVSWKRGEHTVPREQADGRVAGRAETRVRTLRSVAF